MSMDLASQRFVAEQEQAAAERRAAAGWRQVGESSDNWQLGISRWLRQRARRRPRVSM